MKATCKECGKAFVHPTRLQADQALRLHVLQKHRRGFPRSKRGPAKRKGKKPSEPIPCVINFCPHCGLNIAAVNAQAYYQQSR